MDESGESMKPMEEEPLKGVGESELERMYSLTLHCHCIIMF